MIRHLRQPLYNLLIRKRFHHYHDPHLNCNDNIEQMHLEIIAVSFIVIQNIANWLYTINSIKNTTTFVLEFWSEYIVT